ncbi:MAG: hypothetical protein SGI77_15980 [Pirellulaceae bacterium]|nr:hypothetical protein [Pirellulaceae bacterium]
MTAWMGWTKVAATVAIGFASSLTSQDAFAQCASGTCGNVGYADGYGGYVSMPYGSGSSSYGTSFAGNGGYGTWGHRQVQPLFDNYFTQGSANQANAALYVSPVGVPGWVGHTYNTYQPFYPHQYLYQHQDKYHSYYDQGSGLNRTKATYWAPPVHTAVKQIYKKIQLPHQ